MLTAIDLPVAAHSRVRHHVSPYLAITDAARGGDLTQALTDVEMPHSRTREFYEPVSVQRLDAPVLDAFYRLIQLLDEPALLRHLAPLIRREMVVRLLRGPHTSHLSHLVTAGTPRRQVANTVTWLKQNIADTVDVDELAERANMSPSTFRQHFRTITGMSPVQLQKRLRLQEARQLMLNESASAAAASALVGYESASQFNREYRRLFGAAPHRDVRNTLTR